MSLQSEFVAAAVRRAAEPGVRVELSVGTAMALVGQLQLALRHPANTGDTALLVEGFVRGLIDQLAAGPDAAILRKGLTRGFDPDADRKTAAADPAAWFGRWYRALPKAWRAGLWAAINGGAWLGELESRPAAGMAAVGVLFLPWDRAQRVAAAIERGELK